MRLPTLAWYCFQALARYSTLIVRHLPTSFAEPCRTVPNLGYPTLLANSPLTRGWRIVPEQLGHRLFERAIVLVGVLRNVERFGRGAAPNELFVGGIE